MTATLLNVRAFGAAGDGQTLDTLALQAAVDACHAQGGGTVLVPAGQYHIGALALRSHITLHLEAGATLLGSADPADYPIIRGRWEGCEQDTYASLIGGSGLTHIALTGRGVIDGRGVVWWQRHRERSLAYPRPRLISFADCENVLVDGLTAINSPSWTIHPVCCSNVTFHNLTVLNPPDSPTTDGLNPDSCRGVRISDCYVEVGGDCIALKAGSETEAPGRQAPCEHITITNCTLARGHGGVVIGSEMSGGVRHVVVSNCVFTGTDRGLRLKSRRGRGGVVEDVRLTNVVMSGVLCPLSVNLYDHSGARGDRFVPARDPQPIDAGTPRIRRLHLSHITARQVRVAAAFVDGLAELPIEDLTLDDVTILLSPEAEPGYPDMADDLAPMQPAGLLARHVRRLRLRDVQVSGQVGPALRLADCADVDLNNCATPTPAAGVPVFELTSVDGARIHGCHAPGGTEVFLSVQGQASRDIVLGDNDLAQASVPVRVAAGVAPGAVSGVHFVHAGGLPLWRYFDPDRRQQAIAQHLYGQVAGLPLICPHGHVDPRLLADPDYSFGTPVDLLLIPDHYIYRMLYSQGIPLERLGIPRRDGGPVETDHRKIWQCFAEHNYLFRGTPTGLSLAHALREVFGIEQPLTAATAQAVYDQLAEQLAQPAFRPRALFERFNIEVLCTTDAATDPLVHHQAIRASGWGGRVIPCFRPDALVNLDSPGWRANLDRLSAASGLDVCDYPSFVQALENRRAFFKAMGATATDHAAVTPYTAALPAAEAEAIFQRALRGEASADDAAQFTGHMLMEMARMSVDDGLVMQLHVGSFRNHNVSLYEGFGPDTGADIPVTVEFTRNLHPLLNAHGHDPRLTLILFTLDETTYARELAPLAGHYPAVRLGPPWWFFDSLNGMARFFDQVMETAGLYNTAGFNDDTRAFCSIPARHDVWRRASANWLAGLVARGLVTEPDAEAMCADLAYGLAKKAYRL